MRKLKKLLISRYNRIIAILLSLLGFTTACEDKYSPAEYGTPFATFIVNGNVKDETTNDNISNIRVVLNTDTTFTDESGNFQLTYDDFPEDKTYIVEFKDTDGSENGEYDPLDSTIEFVDPEYSGGSGWYSGETEQELNVTLKSKE